MKIHCPELPQNLKEETEWAGLEAWAREEEADISGCRLTGITEPGADLSRLTFRGVRWERCRLNEAEAERAAFIDAEFVGCDLSGANFDAAFFQRCRFTDCKGVGALLPGARLQHVTWDGGDWRYAVLDTAQGKGIRLTRCDFSGSSLSEMRVTGWELEEAELIGVNFSHTFLSGVDLTQCRLEGIRIAGGELKGAVVTPYQAAELALLLGVVIRQE